MSRQPCLLSTGLPVARRDHSRRDGQERAAHTSSVAGQGGRGDALSLAFCFATPLI